MKRNFLLVMLVAAGVAGWKPRPATPAARQVAIPAGEIGSRLPDFSLKDLHGKELSSSGFKGKVVLVDFWATWCQPCKKEMPGYQKLLDAYGKRGLVVVGFKFDTMADTEDPLRFARRIGVRYPLAVASERLRQAFGGIEGLPTTLIYDRRGILREKIVGFEYTSVVESDLKPFLETISENICQCPHALPDIGQCFRQDYRYRAGPGIISTIGIQDARSHHSTGRLDPHRRLRVRPTPTRPSGYDYIYRDASSVRWDDLCGELYVHDAPGFSTVDEFKQIVAAAARSEMTSR